MYFFRDVLYIFIPYTMSLRRVLHIYIFGPRPSYQYKYSAIHNSSQLYCDKERYIQAYGHAPKTAGMSLSLRHIKYSETSNATVKYGYIA
jgi:hypothetical protein